MLDSLYENIGGKIKNWAKWIFIVEAICAVIAGIGLIADDNGAVGFLVMIVGPLVAWVGSWLLYGFGELIETNAETRDLTAELLRCKMSAPSSEGPAPVTVVRQTGATQPTAAPKRTTASSGGWVCTCGRTNASNVSSCVCGVTKFAAAQKKAGNDNVHAEIVNGEKVCPKCGTAQKADRKVCWSCGANFDN